MSNFITNKQDGVSTLGADEWNQIAEINNLILSGGLTLDTNVVNQASKSIANLVSSANFFTENGTANNYTLIASGSFIAPTSYINGMVIRFITTNANTTTTPIVNLAGLGNKNIKKADGTAVIAGDISGYVELRYNGTDFLLSPLSSALNITATNKGLTYLNNPITIANNSTDADNDINFTAGNFQFADGSGQAVLSAMTKRLDASWTAGTNQGGLDTGTKQANTWYHCYAIYNPTSGVSDAIFSTNATSPALPTGYTKYDYIASFLTNASGNIINGNYAFDRVGSYTFKYNLARQDFNGTFSTNVTPYSLSTPLGLNTSALVNIYMDAGVGVGTVYGYFYEFFKDDIGASSLNFNVVAGLVTNSFECFQAAPLEITTNLLSQIRGDVSASSTSGIILTVGFKYIKK